MPPPALVSTITSWPCVTSSRTLAGTSPTRYSWVLISFGTPISIAPALRPNPGTYPSVGLAPKDGRRQRAGASLLGDTGAGGRKPRAVDDLFEAVGAGCGNRVGSRVLSELAHCPGGELPSLRIGFRKLRPSLVLQRAGQEPAYPHARLAYGQAPHATGERRGRVFELEQMLDRSPQLALQLVAPGIRQLVDFLRDPLELEVGVDPLVGELAEAVRLLAGPAVPVAVVEVVACGRHGACSRLGHLSAASARRPGR